MWEEQSQKEDFRVKDKCLVGDEEIEKDNVKRKEICTIGEQ